MAEIAALQVQLDLDTGQFNAKMAQASGSVQKFGRTVDGQQGSLKVMQREISSTKEAIDSLKIAAAGFVGFTAITESITSLLEARIAMDRIMFGLQGALGSAKAAGDAYKFVSDKSKELGLNLEVAATEFMKLTAAATATGVSMADQEKLFDGLARSSAVLHLSADQTKFAIMALGQMFSKGKIQAEELRRQLGEAVPGVVPRFTKAVMKMIEGTDLQGKSFDELLRGGHLYTDQFLPALTQALQETGAGATEAAKGLNAGINLLKTAWFELRAGMSDGLFSDVANAGVRTMAANLQNLASVATLTLGIMAARFVGGGLSMGADKITSALAEQRVNAAGTTIWAQQTKAIASNTAAKLADLKVTQASIVTARASAAAQLQAANAAVTSAQMHLAGSGAASGSFATQQGRIAQERLVVAQKARNVALNNLAQLGTQAVRIEGQLAASALATASANGVAAAAEKARGATATMAGRASGLAKSAGSAAMGLVGGPWGLAALAIGAVSIGLYNAGKRSEEAKIAFKSQGDELVRLRGTVEDVTASYKAMDGNTSVKNLAEVWNASGVAIRKADKDITALDNKLKALLRGNVNNKEGILKFDERAIQVARLEMNNLKMNTEGARAKFSELEVTLKSAVNPATFQAMEVAARNANNVEFAKLMDGLSGVEKRALNAASAIQKINAAIGDDIFAKQVENTRKLRGEFAAYELQQGKKINDAGGVASMTSAARAEMNHQLGYMKSQIALGEQLDASKKKLSASTKESTAITKEQSDDYATLGDRMKRQIENDQDAAASTDKLTQAERLSNAITIALASTKTKLTEVQRKSLLGLQAEMEAQGKATQEIEKAERALKSMVALKAKLAADTQKVANKNNEELASFGKGSDEVERMARLNGLAEDFANELADLEAKGYEAGSTARAQELIEIQNHYAAMLSGETKFQADKAAAQGGWLNGAKSGFADFYDAAMNTSAQVQGVTTRAFSGMTDVVTQFVTTGKADFKSFATAVLADIAKILVQQAIAGIAKAAMSMFAGGGIMSSNGAIDLTKSANGNIMTSSGPLPLESYANGGIAKKPQLSLFGEGKMNEAYVPLPDGRTIPVTMKGGPQMTGGGGGVGAIQISVNIDNNGNASEDAERGAGREEGKQLAEMIKVSCVQIITQESKQGGMLWKMRK